MTHILDIFAERSPDILARAHNFLESQKHSLGPVNVWAVDALERMQTFMQRGKCIRGNLALLGAEIGGAPLSTGLYDAAAALELFQSSILIHDDIIDQDALRRGQETLHTQYTRAVQKTVPPSHAEHVGISLAICLADMGFNLTYTLLASADLPPAAVRSLTAFWGVEFAKVGLAEMDDVFLAHSSEPAALERILALYRFKTARYTFCVPLLSGLIIANAPAALQNAMEELSELLGLIFQIKDDELGIFGDETALGKPVGSDIRENKKTIFHHYLFTACTCSPNNDITACFGNDSLDDNDIQRVRDFLTDSGIRAAVDTRITGYSNRARDLINSLALSSELKTLLLQLVHYNLTRTT